MKKIAKSLLTILPLLAGCSSPHTQAIAAGTIPAQATSGPQNEAALYLNLVTQLEAQQHYDSALAFLDAYALNRSDPEPRYWLLRGEALLASHRGEDARPAFERLKKTALAADGWNGCGQVSADAGQWSEAKEDFQSAVQMRPTAAQFLNNLAFAEMHLGQASPAVTSLRQAYDLDSGSDLIRNNLIIALTLAGDKAGAERIMAEIPNEDDRQHMRAFLDKSLAGADALKGSLS